MFPRQSIEQDKATASAQGARLCSRDSPLSETMLPRQPREQGCVPATSLAGTGALSKIATGKLFLASCGLGNNVDANYPSML